MPAASKTKAKPKPASRPAYSEDLAVDICGRIMMRGEDGNLRSLRDVCAEAGMPAERTVYQWLAKHERFAQMYARAREERAHMIADDIITIADTEPDPNKARVRIDARKWWAAKVNVKSYGDKIINENVNTNYNITDKPLSQDEWAEKYCVGSAARTPGSA